MMIQGEAPMSPKYLIICYPYTLPAPAGPGPVGGLHSLLPGLLPISVDPADYDVIFVGTPIWCGTIAPIVAAFPARYKLSGKVPALFYSHCGGGAKLDQLLSVWLKELGLSLQIGLDLEYPQSGILSVTMQQKGSGRVKKSYVCRLASPCS